MDGKRAAKKSFQELKDRLGFYTNGQQIQWANLRQIDFGGILFDGAVDEPWESIEQRIADTYDTESKKPKS